MKIRVEITIIENRKTRGKNNSPMLVFGKDYKHTYKQIQIEKKREQRFKFVKSGMKEGTLLPSSQNFLNIKKDTASNYMKTNLITK